MSIRLNATAIAVQHEGETDASEYVNVTYYQDGQVKKVKAKSILGDQK